MNKKSYTDGFERQPDGTYRKSAKEPGYLTLPVNLEPMTLKDTKKMFATSPDMKFSKKQIGRAMADVEQQLCGVHNITNTAKSMLDHISGVKTFTVKTAPVAAPRMTRQDKWKKRPCVMRYFAFRDRVREAAGKIEGVPDRVDCEFYIVVPKSWSKPKKLAMDGKPHREKPDADNLWKSVGDSLFDNDCAIHEISAIKRWCWPGQERVEIKFTYIKP